MTDAAPEMDASASSAERRPDDVAAIVAPMLAAPLGIDVMPPGWLQLLLATPVQFGLDLVFPDAGRGRIGTGSGLGDGGLDSVGEFGEEIVVTEDGVEHVLAAHAGVDVGPGQVIGLAAVGQGLEHMDRGAGCGRIVMRPFLVHGHSPA